MTPTVEALRIAVTGVAGIVSDSSCGIRLPHDPDRDAVLHAIDAWRAWYGRRAEVCPADRAPLTALARLLAAVCEETS